MTIGKTFSHYEILEKLGEGGMGEVVLARDPTLDRRVALKFLSEKLAQDEIAKKRFLREAKSAAALDHPYICKIYEIGEAEGRPFIAMEYVRGETLEHRIARGALPLGEAQRIAHEIAEALETAHQEGIVHRDLKPANIMLTEDGHVKVLDFGLAKRVASPEDTASELETASRLTGEGMTPGTVAYMSPEQVRARAVDPRSDIFSFGVVLYEMVASVHPFAKATAMDTAAAILNLAPPALRSHRKEAPELLEHVVGKMLAKVPEERYQLVHEVRTDLARLQERSRDVRTPTPSTHLFAGKKAKRALAGVAVVVVLAVFGWLIDSMIPREPPSVAVLPFKNVSDDPLDSDYLAEGITRAVITKLTQAGLQVTPWQTARRYGDTILPAEQIARDLNAGAVLMGTFELVDDRIVTTLSLVDGKTGFQSWADEFEEPFDDIFRVQRRIAMGTAVSLKRRLTGEEEEALATPASRSVDAYDFYMQGAHVMQEGTEEATNVAFQYFTRAVELDPNLVEAHVGLGAVYDARYWFGWGGGLTNLDRAAASYDRALQLNPASMRAHRGLIMVHNYRGRSEASLAQGQLAGRSGPPDDVETLMARAEAYHYGGLTDRALPLYRRVIEIDPLNEAAHWHLVVAAYFVGAFEDAIEAGSVYFGRFGDDEMIHSMVARSHHSLGNVERAREHYGNETAASYPPALLDAGLLFEQVGERERAEQAWRRGVEMLEPKLEAYPDDKRTRTLLACFYGLLGERASFSAEAERVVSSSNPGDLYTLAAIIAKLGETDRAVELLRRSVRQGRILPLWERPFELASVSLPASESMDEFHREYQTLERRLRETY